MTLGKPQRNVVSDQAALRFASSILYLFLTLQILRFAAYINPTLAVTS